MTKTSQRNPESDILGELPPIYASSVNRQPDKRQVSFRWLASSILVGLTSLFLMGGALYAALDGRQELTNQGAHYEKTQLQAAQSEFVKGDKPGIEINVAPSTSNIMMVSTVSKEGDKDVVKVRPFMHISAPMAVAPKSEYRYPKFNALAIFSESSKEEVIAKASNSIYGANVESQVTIKTVDFPHDDPAIANEPKQDFTQIETLVRNSIAGLNDGTTLISPVAYFDDTRFSLNNQETFVTAPNVTITAENVSVMDKLEPETYVGKHYTERAVPIKAQATLATILETEGMDPAEAGLIENVVSADLGDTELRNRDRLELSFETIRGQLGAETRRVAKMSVFRADAHLVSIARTDDDRFVYAAAPKIAAPSKPETNTRKVVSRSRLPSAYDGIYRAALSEGLTQELSSVLVKIFAFDVDFKSQIDPSDELSVFVSLEDDQERPTEESEILHASITLNGVIRRYYRFRDNETGRVDYYDETGKSAKKFLLRQPVPNGRFRSPYGMRRHPVLRYNKMHWGVDWAAPSGTKILAAGNGVIKKAGWAGGNGRRIVIRHANGYETSYSHLRGYAKGIRAGHRVRQGQLIGYVGSSGLSTGPHLHYEVRVNGNRVNPMRIRLPQGKVLRGAELAEFEAERNRIDALLKIQSDSTTLAALN